jgi:hypothetical protein
MTARAGAAFAHCEATLLAHAGWPTCKAVLIADVASLAGQSTCHMPRSARWIGLLAGILLLLGGLTCFLASEWLIYLTPFRNSALLQKVTGLGHSGQAFQTLRLGGTATVLQQAAGWGHRVGIRSQQSLNESAQGWQIAPAPHAPHHEQLAASAAAAGPDAELHAAAASQQAAGSAGHLLTHHEQPSGPPAFASQLQHEAAAAGAPGSNSSEVEQRCRGTLGTWCQAALGLPLIPSKQPPTEGSKACAFGCSGRGNCNADTGLCDCPAGTQHLQPCMQH